MRKINLFSVIDAKKTLSGESFERFRKFCGFYIKNSEIEYLESLISNFQEHGAEVADFENFYVGYKIPQIGKEFDLFRFGTSCIINIELKRKSDPEKIIKQLKRNAYYLGFSGENVHYYVPVWSGRSGAVVLSPLRCSSSVTPWEEFV